MIDDVENEPKVGFGYHFLSNDGLLRDYREPPPIGQWLEQDGEIEICRKGLHGSRKVMQAMAYAPGFTLTYCEFYDIRCEHIDKFVAKKRKILWKINAKSLLQEYYRFWIGKLFEGQTISENLKNWIADGQNQELVNNEIESLLDYLRYGILVGFSRVSDIRYLLPASIHGDLTYIHSACVENVRMNLMYQHRKKNGPVSLQSDELDKIVSIINEKDNQLRKEAEDKLNQLIKEQREYELLE